MPEAFVAASQLTARLWRAMDLRRHDDVLALLTEDCRWFRDGAWQAGGAAIGASLERRPADRFVRHIVSNFIVDRDGDAIACAYYLTVYHGGGPDTGTPHPAAAPFAMADVTMRVTGDDGALRIAEIGMTVTFLHAHT